MMARDNDKNVYLIGKDNNKIFDTEMDEKDMVNFYGKDEEETK